MKSKKRLFLIIILFLFSVSQVDAQWTIGLNASTYTFVSSQDQNIHYGGQFRLNHDWLNNVIEYDFGYYAPAISPIHTTVSEIDLGNPFPAQLSIINSVSAISMVNNINYHYYFYGKPIFNTGYYALAGLGTFYYRQTYHLSSFDNQKYFSQQYIDGATYSSTQLVLNIGVGGKYAIRNSSWFYELKFSYLTNPYNDWDRAVQGSHFITFSTGFRFHVKTRKTHYQIMSMGRTKRQRKKALKKLRK